MLSSSKIDKNDLRSTDHFIQLQIVFSQLVIIMRHPKKFGSRDWSWGQHDAWGHYVKTSKAQSTQTYSSMYSHRKTKKEKTTIASNILVGLMKITLLYYPSFVWRSRFCRHQRRFSDILDAERLSPISNFLVNSVSFLRTSLMVDLNLHIVFRLSETIILWNLAKTINNCS